MRLRCANAITALVGYLRHGQPHAAPPIGYSTLLALQPRRLTDVEIDILASYFAQLDDSPITDIDIAVAIMNVTDDLAGSADIDRVRGSLPRTG
ncbi:MAG: DUF3349 domain-containing protein [Mycobacterium sp.]|nr:DUF3349 domain-containing protein [Mycobacterium sp.]